MTLYLWYFNKVFFLCCLYFVCINLFTYFQVCLGAEAEDKFHMVEVEGLTYDGKSTKVPLVILKPSVMPSVSETDARTCLFISLRWQILTAVIVSSCLSSIFPLPQMSLGGFEITPPITFRLQSGSGPVHISGQHFVRRLSGFFT